MSQTLHQELVELRGRAKAWLDTGRSEQFDPMDGICNNLRLSHLEYGLLDDLLAEWPAGTGGANFPVPHPTNKPFGAFILSNPQEMWNPEFEYARNRWALLEWLIEQTASEADQ